MARKKKGKAGRPVKWGCDARLVIRIPQSTIDRIDRTAGSGKRAEWIRGLIERELDGR